MLGENTSYDCLPVLQEAGIVLLGAQQHFVLPNECLADSIACLTPCLSHRQADLWLSAWPLSRFLAP